MSSLAVVCSAFAFFFLSFRVRFLRAIIHKGKAGFSYINLYVPLFVYGDFYRWSSYGVVLVFRRYGAISGTFNQIAAILCRLIGFFDNNSSGGLVFLNTSLCLGFFYYVMQIFVVYIF